MDLFNGTLEKILQSTDAVKKKFESLKKELKNKVVSGNSGAGMVKVDSNARFEILKIDIEDNVLKKNTKAEIEELVRSAVNDSLRKAEAVAGEELKKASESLNLPFDISSFIK